MSKRKQSVEILYFGNGYMITDYMNGYFIAEFNSRIEAVEYCQQHDYKLVKQM